MAIQLPGKLFTDFEAWDTPQSNRPETRGPKYCYSSFDAITVGKLVPSMPKKERKKIWKCQATHNRSNASPSTFPLHSGAYDLSSCQLEK